MGKRRDHRTRTALFGSLVLCLGCGGSTGTIDGQLSEKARESVFQKKVDLKNRPGTRTQNRSPRRSGAEPSPSS
jgi:hypothetical protein